MIVAIFSNDLVKAWTFKDLMENQIKENEQRMPNFRVIDANKFCGEREPVDEVILLEENEAIREAHKGLEIKEDFNFELEKFTDEVEPVVTDTPVVEPPVVDTPVVEPPVVDTPVVEPPVTKPSKPKKK